MELSRFEIIAGCAPVWKKHDEGGKNPAAEAGAELSDRIFLFAGVCRKSDTIGKTGRLANREWIQCF